MGGLASLALVGCVSVATVAAFSKGIFKRNHCGYSKVETVTGESLYRNPLRFF